VGPSPSLTAKAFVGLAQLAVIMGTLVFLVAGTWRYLPGWVFLGEFLGCALAITLYLLRRDPALLEKRVQAGPAAEGRVRQKIIQAFASLAFVSILIVPALDHRFAWSRVPVPIVACGDLLVAVGFLIVFLVFRENSFASAKIEVVHEQRVVDTGLYARVRHPMYAGALVLLAGTPLALGSFCGLVILAPFTAIIVWRLLDEETALANQLPGYTDYLRKVRFRLIPRIW
jgi:protein-S-isoprenylcysteine O-methyltransferase Ste14